MLHQQKAFKCQRKTFVHMQLQESIIEFIRGYWIINLTLIYCKVIKNNEIHAVMAAQLMTIYVINFPEINTAYWHIFQTDSPPYTKILRHTNKRFQLLKRL